MCSTTAVGELEECIVHLEAKRGCFGEYRAIYLNRLESLMKNALPDMDIHKDRHLMRRALECLRVLKCSDLSKEFSDLISVGVRVGQKSI